ncbi:hypothetical protein SAY87_022457 [Trapa incisa]|uniref:BHLH domain-containing protein n=1 Tax=Trapa incisa TaxID=236973 RepID=A0AAN7K3U0_9MYRT|nr:hypothetical protein SAY87_022457 [Trapa incisa]
MSRCVPDWYVDENPIPTRLSARSNSNSGPPDVPILDYEVAELTWENGQLAMHGLGQPRVTLKPQPQQPPLASAAALPNSKYTWEKLPRVSFASNGTGTLESIVNQAASSYPQRKQSLPGAFHNVVPWFDCSAGQHTSSATMTMDALVPCATAADTAENQHQSLSAVRPACVVGCSTHVGSCSEVGVATGLQEGDVKKRSRIAASLRVPVVGTGEWIGRDQYSVSGSATMGRERVDSDLQLTVDTCEREVYTSMGSQDNTSYGAILRTQATADELDSVCHSQSQKEAGDGDGDEDEDDDEEEDDKAKRNGKPSLSMKRSRAAAIHNQSERKRRDKINQRMKTLQKLVPNSSKTDKASVLDEVIDYLKQLQAQVQMMSRMNMQPMMMAAMQQQLQMSMMAAAPMGLGMGMGAMGMAGIMDMTSLAGPNLSGLPPNVPTPIIHPMAAAAASTTPFLPMGPPWDGSCCNGDPLSAFLACQSQPMTLDTYSRMTAMYQQLHQPPASSSKN